MKIGKRVLREALLSEAHGVSNGWLVKFRDYVLKEWKRLVKGEVILRPSDFADAVSDFPSYYRELMGRSLLRITNESEGNGSGMCDVERIGDGEYLITIYLSDMSYDKEATLLHEFSHMLDMLSGGGDECLRRYADGLADRGGRDPRYMHMENNFVAYGFSETEMKARLNGFKHQLRRGLSEDELFMRKFSRGYQAGFEAFREHVLYSDAWANAIRRYEERYESVVEKDLYCGGNIEFARALGPYLGLRGIDMTKGEDEYTEEEREAITYALVVYFRRLISGYRKRLWRVALDVWYDFVDAFRGTCERSRRSDCYRRFMSNKAINGNE